MGNRHLTGAGNPDWAQTHTPATAHAAVVPQPLDAGCSLVGKAHCAELASSLSGRNVYYGRPRNPAAPARQPGGSAVGNCPASPPSLGQPARQITGCV